MRGSADLNSRALKRVWGEMKIFQWDKISEKMPRAAGARISAGVPSGRYIVKIKRGVADLYEA